MINLTPKPSVQCARAERGRRYSNVKIHAKCVVMAMLNGPKIFWLCFCQCSASISGISGSDCAIFVLKRFIFDMLSTETTLR